MADNVLLNAGTGGDTVAADDIAGVKIQRVKIVQGADGVNDGDVASGAPLNVTLANGSVPSHAVTNAGTFATQVDGAALTALQLIDDPVHADDAARGKSLLIGAVLDDTSPTAITENQAGYLRMSTRRALLVEGVASGTAVKVDGSAVTQPVSAASLPLPSGASTLSEQQTQTTSLQLMDDAVHTDDQARSKSLLIGAVLDDTSPTAVTENQAGYLRMSSRRALLVEGVASATAIKVDGSAVAQPVTDNSGSLTVDAPVGTPVFVRLSDGAASVTPVVGAQLPAALVSSRLDVNLGATPAGAGVIAKAEDSASADLDVGVPAMAVRKASPANTSGTDGDYEMLQMSAGRLWASATIDAALPAGTNAIGKLAANSGVDIGDVDVTSLPNVTLAAGTNTNEVVGDVAHDGVAAGNPVLVGGYASAAAPADVSADADAARAWFLRNGAQATVITAAGALIGGDAANGLDVDVIRLPASTNTIEVVGDVAHDAAAAGNPVLIGASHETIADTAPTNRLASVTDGDCTRLSATDGAIFVIPTGPQNWSTVNTGALSATSVKAAPGSGLSFYITGMQFSIGAATASSIKLTISGGADLVGPHYLEAINGRGMALTFNTPLKVTANTALVATTSGSTTCTLNVQGFTAPG